MFFLVILSSILNNIWAGGGPEWAYWSARFLFPVAIFPKSILQLLVKEDSFDDIERWRFVLIGLVLSSPFFWFGIIQLTNMVRRWSVECLSIIECL